MAQDMASQIEKLRAHVSYLLDGFLRLRERYAMLDPMLFEENVPKLRGSGKQWRGFMILRHSLFLSCVQDIVKLANDRDKRTASIRNLIMSLEDASLLHTICEKYSRWHAPLIEQETDQEVIEIIKHMDLQEEMNRRIQFYELLDKTRKQWLSLSASSYMKAMLTVRDKITAHSEVEFVEGKYQIVDIGLLGLKWSELRKAIEEMQNIIEGLGLLIRNSGFAWELLDEQLYRASRDFWLYELTST